MCQLLIPYGTVIESILWEQNLWTYLFASPWPFWQINQYLYSCDLTIDNNPVKLFIQSPAFETFPIPDRLIWEANGLSGLYPVQHAFTRQRALLGKHNQVWRQLSS